MRRYSGKGTLVMTACRGGWRAPEANATAQEEMCKGKENTEVTIYV